MRDEVLLLELPLMNGSGEACGGVIGVYSLLGRSWSNPSSVSEEISMYGLDLFPSVCSGEKYRRPTVLSCRGVDC